jgi:hypothetical protein
MKRNPAKLAELRAVQAKANKLRSELGVSDPNEEVWQADVDDGLMVVVADGEGGADLMLVEGNYPVDYMTNRQKSFKSEDRACAVADRLLQHYNNEWDSEKAMVFGPYIVSVRAKARDKDKDWGDLLDEVFGKREQWAFKV